MTQLRGWLGLVRIDTLFAMLLALGSYPLSAGKAWVLPTITVGGIFAATMLWNACYDREHDAKMGRIFAQENKSTLLRLTIYAWVVVAVLLLLVANTKTPWEFWILLGMAAGGFGYAWCRLVPGLSMLVVAAVFTAPLLLGTPDPTLSQKLNAATFFAFILVVELRGDLRDRQHDQVGPWKRSVPVVFGVTWAMIGYIFLAFTPFGIGVMRAALEFNPFVRAPTFFSRDLINIGAGLCVLSLMPLFMSTDLSTQMRYSGWALKLAMICFITAFLLD